MAKLIGDGLGVLVKGAGLFVLLAAVWTLADHFWNRQIYIDAIELPKALADGPDLNGTVIAQRLKDELDHIGEGAWTVRQTLGSTFAWDQPDLEVPGTSYTLRGLKRMIAAFFNLPGRRISGEIMPSGEDFLLRLRLDGKVISRDRPIDPRDLVASLQPVAEDALRAIDPFTLAAWHAAQGDDEEVVRLIRHCLREEPEEDDAWAYNLWGIIQFGAGATADAEQSFRAAMFEDPALAPAYLNLAALLTNEGRFEEAHELYWRLKALAEADAGFYARWAELHVRKAEFARRDALMTQIKGDDPRLVEALRRSASRDYERARELYQESLVLDPGYAIARIGLSRLHMLQHADAEDPAELEAAERELRQAILFQPPAAFAYVERAAEFDARTKDPLSAARRLRLAMEVLTEDARVRHRWAHIVLNQYADRLLQEMRRRRELSALDGVGRPTDTLAVLALHALDQAIQLQPDEPLLQITRAQILLERQEYEEVRATAARAIRALNQSLEQRTGVDRLLPEADLNRQIYLASMLKAKAAVFLGHHGEAMQDVLEAVKRQPEDGVLYAQTEGIEPPEILLLFLRAFSAGAEDPRARSLHVIAPNP